MIPPPTAAQARALWFSVTALAIAVTLFLIGLTFWGLGLVVNKLSSVLMPLAIAGIIACLMSPVVHFLEKQRIPRVRAILLVFFMALMFLTLVAATVIPRVFYEAQALSRRFSDPDSQWLVQLKKLEVNLPWIFPTDPAVAAPVEPTTSALALPNNSSQEIPPLTEPTPPGSTSSSTLSVPSYLDSELAVKIVTALREALPAVGKWVLAQVGRVASWFGLLAGLALIPIYVFYFLLEQKNIERSWSAYVPLRDSWGKGEFTFILRAINERLVTFFRGQVLVAMCVGTLLTTGFLAMGLNYAVLLGVIAGLFGIIPYLGVLISLIPAVLLALIQFGDWWHPALVLGIFAAVQMLEGLIISPKIIGDRVGLHPLTIIIAVMVGTTLMGGIIGGILAIPLTAVLRELMFRYVWKSQPHGTNPTNL